MIIGCGCLFVKPVVAIVGRPNVGKSTLFNRLVEEQRSITAPTPGVTRDRIYGDVQWTGHHFVAIDTGGWQDGPAPEPLEKMTDRRIGELIRQQVQQALQQADVVLMVVDGRAGVTALDEMVAELVRPLDMPVVLAVNKIDDLKHEGAISDFYSLGLGEPIGVSAEHGRNTGDLLDAVVEVMPPEADEHQLDVDAIRVALVGRPNVGKSSLLNALLEDERVLVSEAPGTTRDAVEVEWHWRGHKFVFVDTAGLRKRARVTEDLEGYSVARALGAVRRCDVAVLMLDANEMVTEQDQRIARFTLRNGKAAVIAVNKWDTVETETGIWETYMDLIDERLYFVDYAHRVSISATEGLRIMRIPEYVMQAYSAYRTQFATSEINQSLRRVMLNHPPPAVGGTKLKVYYATQVADGPPTFLCFVNNPKLLTDNYRRYLLRALREQLQLVGTPIRIRMRKSE